MGSSPTARTTSPRTTYRSRRLFTKVTARSFCRGSFPNRTRCCWAPVWFHFGDATSSVSPFVPRWGKVRMLRFRQSAFGLLTKACFAPLPLLSKLQPRCWVAILLLSGRSPHVPTSESGAFGFGFVFLCKACRRGVRWGFSCDLGWKRAGTGFSISEYPVPARGGHVSPRT